MVDDATKVDETSSTTGKRSHVIRRDFPNSARTALLTVDYWKLQDADNIYQISSYYSCSDSLLIVTLKLRLRPRPTAFENLSLGRGPCQAVRQGPARPGLRGPASAGLRPQSRAAHNTTSGTRATAAFAAHPFDLYHGYLHTVSTLHCRLLHPRRRQHCIQALARRPWERLTPCSLLHPPPWRPPHLCRLHAHPPSLTLRLTSTGLPCPAFAEV